MTIAITSDRCIVCKKCVNECPTKSIGVVEDAIRQVAPSVCLACGHCAAVCPCDALSWDASDSAPPFTLSDKPDDIFRKTRSVRGYRADPISKETVTKMITFAEAAPSGDNFRTREYVVVSDREAINQMEQLLTGRFKKVAGLLSPALIQVISLFSKRLAFELRFVKKLIGSFEERHLEDSHPILRDAPCVVLIVGPKGSLLAKDDCVAAQNYMRLAGTTLGLASCIIGFVGEANGVLEKYLGIKKSQKIYAATVFGWQSAEWLKNIEYPEPVVIWK